MKKIKYTIVISANSERVWEVLWSDTYYRQWTVPFGEGSHALSNWKEGDVIQFLDPENNGMYAIIEQNQPYRTMVFRQEGEVCNGQLVAQDWGGAKECYFLQEADGTTQLTVEADTNEQFEAFFSEAFPKALVLVKSLSEG